jgi:hypothetical protein
VSQLDLIAPPRTLDAARADVEAAIVEGGIECPCCGQFAKLYRRKLNSNMVAFLVSLVRLHRADLDDGGDGWVHFKECTFVGRDYSYLRAWDLATMRAADPDDSTRRVSGYWRPTPQGILFARGMAKAPLRVHLYNNVVRGFDAEMVGVRAALGDHFDYNELMGW